MKNFCCLVILFFLAAKCFAQDSFVRILQVDRLPANGVLLDKGWKFHPGDNPDWARPDYNDRGWEDIDPTNDLYYLSELKKYPIGWFRIRFKVDTSLLNKPLSCKIYQSIASEIYLNGELLAAYGSIDVQSNKVNAYRTDYNPVGIIFHKTEQVLAVKFGVEMGLPLTATTHPYFAFRFRILDAKLSPEFKEIGHKYPLLNTLWAGIFLTLALIHLGIFFKFRNRKADLFFSIAMISEAIAHLFFILLEKGGQSLKFITYGFVADWILLISAYNFFLYIAIRQLFRLKGIVIHWTIICLLVTGIIFFLYSYEYGQTIGLHLCFLVTIILSVILAWKAYKKGTRGALIIVGGFSIYLVLYISFLFFYAGLIKDVELGIFREFSLTDLLYFVSITSIPFSLSIFLAYDFSSTSSRLQKKLEEVQYLSEKTINQEKEKQDILSSQKQILEERVAERTSELNQSLEELKSTQSQLIQSEKMASLGELTAGIAHEIQNPLNFVNNFSEVNKELLVELKDEIKKGNYGEVDAIADDVISNEEKINHHGKRADSIVKGMLQHSQSSSGVKESTDINALADEYLRLAYHGLRAKDKNLNATIKTDFDESIGRIKIIPQDIGRVLLNLYNNAFYAVSEKQKLSIEGYQPTVSVRTKKVNGELEVSVADNGNGIPEKVLDKVFQPFFTTKPTGQGTGLGLSLSYDIIKAHQGKIDIRNKPGEGAEFIITLPINA